MNAGLAEDLTETTF